MFTTRHRGSPVTTLALHGRTRGVGARLGLAWFGSAVLWTGMWAALLLRHARIVDLDAVTRSHLSAGCIIAGFALVFVSGWWHGAVVKRLGHHRAALAGTATAAATGATAAGIVLQQAFGGRGGLLPAFTWTASALAALACAWAVAALRRARRRQELALWLRAHGRRHRGELDEVHFRRLWILERPQFYVGVRYRDGGQVRRLRAAMSTLHFRVPLPGYPVWVMVGPQGETLVEPDLTRPRAFDGSTDYRPHSPAGDGAWHYDDGSDGDGDGGGGGDGGE